MLDDFVCSWAYKKVDKNSDQAPIRKIKADIAFARALVSSLITIRDSLQQVYVVYRCLFERCFIRTELDKIKHAISSYEMYGTSLCKKLLMWQKAFPLSESEAVQKGLPEILMHSLELWTMSDEFDSTDSYIIKMETDIQFAESTLMCMDHYVSPIKKVWEEINDAYEDVQSEMEITRTCLRIWQTAAD
ncbi:hypothetical protein BGX34_006672 [Mortierella sp. NVP85]|nr:hypothetical protein BGX34_006672 [Mortierella sp. NVP85]